MANPEKDRFFDLYESMHTALTYDDVRLRTRHGYDKGPIAPDITSKFSRNIELKTPFVSAAMDTVTEKDMAIAMAMLGGIGVIHAAMEPDEQKRQARDVKFKLGGKVERPITVSETQSVESVLNEYGNKPFDTFPVTDSEGRCVGVISGRDFNFYDGQGTVKEHMTPEGGLVTAPVGTSIQNAYEIMMRNKINMLPVLDDDKRVKEMFLWSDVKRVIRDNSGMFNVDSKGRLRVAAAISTDQGGLERFEEIRKYIDAVVLDSADGDSYYMFQTLEKLIENIKNSDENIDIVAGNVSDGESARMLATFGVDGIKVGQGPGSICSTRREIGIGMPQVSAVWACAKAIRGTGIPVCADGGIRYHGDIPIAFAVGAGSVMMGSMLAGTTESPGEVIVQQDGTRGKKYRGMGSASALRESSAARGRYGDNGEMPLPEGVEGTVPFKGPAVDVLGDCKKALVKAMKYVKAANIDELRDEVMLTRITGAGLAESHPHSINILR